MLSEFHVFDEEWKFGLHLLYATPSNGAALWTGIRWSMSCHLVIGLYLYICVSRGLTDLALVAVNAWTRTS